MSAATLTDGQLARQSWMGIMARATVDDLETQWSAYQNTNYTMLREPEIGLVMVRGRAGGTGQRFNLGEMTVSRCSVTLGDGTIGHGYVKGRNRRHAELIAVFDALFQQDQSRSTFLDELSDAQSATVSERSARAAATKVDFYTMVRGED